MEISEIIKSFLCKYSTAKKGKRFFGIFSGVPYILKIVSHPVYWWDCEGLTVPEWTSKADADSWFAVSLFYWIGWKIERSACPIFAYPLFKQMRASLHFADSSVALDNRWNVCLSLDIVRFGPDILRDNPSQFGIYGKSRPALATV